MVATLDTRSAAEACRVEHQILDHVKSALRVTLDWNAPEVGISRKLESVRFTLKSFQRHLERLMELEEFGGYMEIVDERKPNFHDRAMQLREEHDEFRCRLMEVVVAADHAPDDSRESVANVCQEINALLAKIDDHDRREIELIQETMMLDEGGEG